MQNCGRNEDERVSTATFFRLWSTSDVRDLSTETTCVVWGQCGLSQRLSTCRHFSHQPPCEPVQRASPCRQLVSSSHWPCCVKLTRKPSRCGELKIQPDQLVCGHIAPRSRLWSNILGRKSNNGHPHSLCNLPGWHASSKAIRKSPCEKW